MALPSHAVHHVLGQVRRGVGPARHSIHASRALQARVQLLVSIRDLALLAHRLLLRRDAAAGLLNAGDALLLRGSRHELLQAGALRDYRLGRLSIAYNSRWRLDRIHEVGDGDGLRRFN